MKWIIAVVLAASGVANADPVGDRIRLVSDECGGRGTIILWAMDTYNRDGTQQQAWEIIQKNYFNGTDRLRQPMADAVTRALIRKVFSDLKGYDPSLTMSRYITMCRNNPDKFIGGEKFYIFKHPWP